MREPVTLQEIGKEISAAISVANVGNRGVGGEGPDGNLAYTQVPIRAQSGPDSSGRSNILSPLARRGDLRAAAELQT